MEKLQAGDTVMIYAIPSTEQGEIGEAMLVEKLDQGGGLELWNVELIDRPGRIQMYWIKTPKYVSAYEHRLLASREFNFKKWMDTELSKQISDEI